MLSSPSDDYDESFFSSSSVRCCHKINVHREINLRGNDGKDVKWNSRFEDFYDEQNFIWYT